ncbi:MAG TPA: outer membrane beta-barrel protein, partial [Vicinamibacterales bacterium]
GRRVRVWSHQPTGRAARYGAGQVTARRGVGTIGLVIAAAMVVGGRADAQTRRPPPRPAPTRPADAGFRLRGFGEAGLRLFAASDTFEAVLGSSSGPIFGGGVEALWGRHLGVSFDVGRYQATGERVFVSNGEVFPLGIETEVSVVPLAVTATYRFPRPRSAVTPFVGGGINWHRYTETSTFAEASEDVSATFAGFHVAGGAEWRVSRLVAIGGVGRWLSVPDALGTEPTSAGAAFGEHDLGGFEAKVRIVVGR